MITKRAERVKQALKKGSISFIDRGPQPQDLLSTGSTLLNLACSGNWKGGFSKGRYFFIVGDSASGKTFLTLTCLAEASINPAFDNYRLIYDDVEGGALMNIRKFFGDKLADRIEPPMHFKEEPIYSSTVDDFYFNLDDAVSGDRPCIYILDSMDALTSPQEQDKFQERKTAARKGRTTTGTMTDGKAKINSSGIRTCLFKLRNSGSILIVVNQTRDNIRTNPFEPAKTRSGGHALTFYAAIELWSSVAGKIKRTVRGTQRIIGAKCKVRVKKNRISGKEREVFLPIYYYYGIDDIGSCVDYLITEKQWTISDGGIVDPKKDLGELGPMRRTKLIEMIEEKGLQQDLRDLVGTVWAEVEQACEEKRKPRY